MTLIFQNTELTELMKDFYVLTGIKIALFDASFNELISYPNGEISFCSHMRMNETFCQKCSASDKEAFNVCKQTKSLHIYRCHAGLIEATAPITERGRILGYMMFGQINDSKDKDCFFSQVLQYCNGYGEQQSVIALVKKIKYKSQRQIHAAAKILDACTEYIKLKEIVKPSAHQLIDKVESFIEEHIGEDLSVDRICRQFNISSTRLYETVRTHTNMGIAALVKKKRLEYAKKLIQTTDMPISQISCEAGFSDYNYFLRVFKETYGVPSKQFRKRI